MSPIRSVLLSLAFLWTSGTCLADDTKQAAGEYELWFRPDYSPERQDVEYWRRYALQRHSLTGAGPRGRTVELTSYRANLSPEQLHDVLHGAGLGHLSRIADNKALYAWNCAGDDILKDLYTVTLASNVRDPGVAARRVQAQYGLGDAAGPIANRVFSMSIPPAKLFAVFSDESVSVIAGRCKATLKECSAKGPHSGAYEISLSAEYERTAPIGSERKYAEIVRDYGLGDAQYDDHSLTASVPKRRLAEMRNDYRIQSLERPCEPKAGSKFIENCTGANTVPGRFLVRLVPSSAEAMRTTAADLSLRFGAKFHPQPTPEMSAVGVEIADDRVRQLAADPRVAIVSTSCRASLY